MSGPKQIVNFSDCDPFFLCPGVTGRPFGSVAQWTGCSHGLQEVLGSSPGRAMCFFPVLGLQAAKELSRWVRHGSE